jgi:hypothetical protein
VHLLVISVFIILSAQISTKLKLMPWENSEREFFFVNLLRFTMPRAGFADRRTRSVTECAEIVLLNTLLFQNLIQKSYGWEISEYYRVEIVNVYRLPFCTFLNTEVGNKHFISECFSNCCNVKWPTLQVHCVISRAVQSVHKTSDSDSLIFKTPTATPIPPPS